MEEKFRAVLKGARISPRKARLVVDMVRGKPVQTALDVLRVTHRKASPIVTKLIHSALKNAQKKATVDVDQLVVSEIFVDEGPTMRRFIPRAHGRASPIRKRTSHITVKLAEF